MLTHFLVLTLVVLGADTEYMPQEGGDIQVSYEYVAIPGERILDICAFSGDACIWGLDHSEGDF